VLIIFEKTLAIGDIDKAVGLADLEFEPLMISKLIELVNNNLFDKRSPKGLFLKNVRIVKPS